mmetsp:Transcript_74347/g.217985  ORF Transcript_74347/g.217985 Transcript_74347/m.217985 type:complete len:360 (+) Transcript_74347:58-1137(+)
MRAWVVKEAGKPLELMEFPLPELKGTEVLVRNLYAGVCHSDLHNWHNDFGLAKPPCTLGHEMEAECVAIGPDVLPGTISLGTRYLVHPWIGCGSAPSPCKMCSLGAEQCCARGAPQSFCDGRTKYGGYASHVVVPHPRYLIDVAAAGPLPEGLACVYMCSGLTVFGALKKIGEIPDGPQDLMIVGCGGLGLQAIQFAKYLFGAVPRAADVSPSARAAAEAMGCKVYDPSSKGCLRGIYHETGGGFYAALDLVGSAQTNKFSLNATRRGGTVVTVGLFGGEVSYSLPDLAGSSKRIQGSLTGSLPEAHEMLAAVKARAVEPIPYQIRHISEINQVFEELREGKIVGRCIMRHDGVPRAEL